MPIDSKNGKKLEKLCKRKDEKHEPEKLSNRETTKLMVKRAKLTVIMCNLRSKTIVLQRFIRKSFAVSKNMHTFAATVPTTLPICTANLSGTFAFYNYNYHKHLVL